MGLQAQLVLSRGDEKQWDGNVLRWLEPAVLHSRCGMGGVSVRLHGAFSF